MVQGSLCVLSCVIACTLLYSACHSDVAVVVVVVPVQVSPVRTAVDMRRTLEEALRSQTVVEFPTFHVLVVGTSKSGK